jgi:hypothetical protein
MPAAVNVAFQLPASRRATEIAGASQAIGPMFWGPRLSLQESCRLICEWVESYLTANPR